MISISIISIIKCSYSQSHCKICRCCRNLTAIREKVLFREEKRSTLEEKKNVLLVLFKSATDDTNMRAAICLDRIFDDLFNLRLIGYRVNLD